ncbi:MAG TPA: hypothetical protein VK742_15165 [Candidatus Sulfotelmatobacter sp.]|jgi:hypothetical protein|nr:hypothetical protein [Candidatus Sulfotelmatobacter sp.]
MGTKSIIQVLRIAIIATVLTQRAHADLITGQIGISGAVTFDTGSAATATAVIDWDQAKVQFGAGSFASISSGTEMAFTPATWDFNTNVPITNFWNVAGFKFELLTSTVETQSGIPGSGFVFITGTGVVTGNGYTLTAFVWQINSSDPSINGENTFSAMVASSNTNGAPMLGMKMVGKNMIFNWSDPTFALQSSPVISGTYTNVPNATSPYTNTVTGQQQFFRLQQ